MHRGKPDGLEHFEHDDDCADFYHNIITYYKDTTGCFTITVKSNFSSFMTFFDVLTFPMSVLCITGWDIYVFSHESSETIKMSSSFFYLLHPREGARVCIYWDYNRLQLIIQNCRSTTLPSPPHMPGHGFLANPSGRCVVVKIGAV